MASSSALLQIGPVLSRLQLSTMAPERLTVPNDGRRPVAPHTVEGDTIEPSVSVPIVNGKSPATTDDADPADEPLEPCFRFQGFFVSPPNHLLLNASAPKESFAQRTAPAFFSCVYTYESSSITWSLYGVLPHVVLYPFTAKRSLNP